MHTPPRLAYIIADGVKKINAENLQIGLTDIDDGVIIVPSDDTDGVANPANSKRRNER